MRWAQRFGCNFASRTFSPNLQPLSALFSNVHQLSPEKSQGLKNAKNLMYVKRILNSKVKFTWKYDIKIFLAFRKLGAGML